MSIRRDSRPIFILGVEQRSGTNYLRDLLCCHADCAGLGPLGEDHLVQMSHHLIAYADAVAGAWSDDWNLPPGTREQLLAALGDGIAGFLREATGCGDLDVRPVAKTPSARGIEHFLPLFPDAQLLVIVRDGRAVAASGSRSFRGDADDWARRWADGARRVAEFAAKHAALRGRHLVVRYEDLILRPEPELRRILDFLELDEARFDWTAAAHLPVRGSSELRAGASPVHWEPVEKPPEFDPLGRFADWTPRQHARFNWLAGAQLLDFGYEPSGPLPEGRRAALYHGGGGFLKRLRRRLFAALRPQEHRR